MKPELEVALLALAEQVARDDNASRGEQLSELRRYELYFNGFQSLFYDATIGGYRTLQSEVYRDNTLGSEDKYAKVFNILRAYIESIIAAVTANVPRTSFDPEDPTSPDDIATSKAFTNLSKLIDEHNDAIILFIRQMFILYTQGPVFIYNYSKKDKAFGLVTKKNYDIVEQNVDMDFCAGCGEISETVPCQSCGSEDVYSDSVSTPSVEVTEDFYPKAREVIEVYGKLHVKIPKWVTRQSETPYLSLESEFPIALVRSMYPKLADKIGQAGRADERDARRPLRDFSSENTNTTVSRMWIREWAYWNLSDEQRELLSKEYPEGVYLVHIDKLVLEAHPERLDDHWTISEHPLSNRIDFEPLAKGIIPVQQLFNEALNMTWETVEKGIPITFADSDTISIKKLGETPAQVGDIVPVSVKNGESINAKIHQTRSTSLPAELPELFAILREVGEFIIGALPSIYGGSNQGGSETLGEYERSRVSSMQRLGLHWILAKTTWNKMKLKACTEFSQTMVGDQETLLLNQGNTSFAIPIRKVDFRGRVRGVSPQTDESLPLTWIDQATRIQQLAGMKSPPIDTFLYDMNNVDRLARTTGLSDWYVPGSDQRNLQLREIGLLLRGDYVEPDPMVDNPQIHIKVIQDWAASEVGQWIKENNPQGYMAVMQHLQMHNQMMMQMMPQNPEQGDPNANPELPAA